MWRRRVWWELWELPTVSQLQLGSVYLYPTMFWEILRAGQLWGELRHMSAGLAVRGRAMLLQAPVRREGVRPRWLWPELRDLSREPGLSRGSVRLQPSLLRKIVRIGWMRRLVWILFVESNLFRWPLHHSA